jgi:alpha-tubulin suppressor-like RCC1 family protein
MLEKMHYRGDFGRLGHGSSLDQFLPKEIAFFAGRKVDQVACGDTHTLVLVQGGELYSFGRNQNGQLGVGHTNDCLSPQHVEALRVRGTKLIQYEHIHCK